MTAETKICRDTRTAASGGANGRSPVLAVWAITPGGIKQGPKIVDAFEKADFFISSKLASSFKVSDKEIIFTSLAKEVAENFKKYQGHIFIFSTGIAVRLIAPLLKSKLTDPAVVVLDDQGLHAVSLIAGHIGGANDLALKVAEVTGADPVITTATDVNDLPAIDSIAKKMGLAIENPGMIKKINMAFLMNSKIDLYDPYSLVAPLLPEHLRNLTESSCKRPMDLFCSDFTKNVPRETLILRPVFLFVGIGCNRGTSSEEIYEFLSFVFKSSSLSLQSIKKIATTHVKADEEGLLICAEKMGIEIDYFTKQELNSVETIETPSKIVEKHMGVKSVCEAAAILASNRGKLVIPKMKKGNVTVAAARKEPDSL
ncbi:MAG: cobalt-precorrin 5A hydrolase [Thermodesulfobacteriota bacterium]|nr:cobalt-precorrin 5A hydrolase [Thermodesulfobacteriota bacterium]